MFELKIKDQELYDSEKNEFIYLKGATLNLEFSLIALSKWEFETKKPWLGFEHTYADTKLLIKCMTINKVDPRLYDCITNDQFIAINEYVNDKHSASTVTNLKEGQQSNKTITSEYIYYWMVSFNIPFECEKWHLNRLLMLIQICNAEQSTEKMSKEESAAMTRSLNLQRRAKAKARAAKR